MQKVCIIVVAFLCVASASIGRSQVTPKEIGIRFSEQISNGSAGTCGCFELEGASADIKWDLVHFGEEHSSTLGVVVDAGVEHTSSVAASAYGLTLTTVTAGPRYALPARKVRLFAQSLFGLAHGTGSQFPQNSTLVSSANSFALDLGAGADYVLNRRLSVRLVQLDYLRTALPNNSTNWQNSLRVGAGLTFRFSR
ncbi:outer membrane protein [Acidicapsa acidisoli]|uniref:outer membrane protein n=1 Tax=Acidicapsa acidisoli TaxID=1615681 RepID=UPI0021DFF32F|nr:porin family protein [Acidicapsa acidisoli]